MATAIRQDEAEASVFQSDLPVREKLDRARTELLDLSARNRLLNMPHGAKGSKSVSVVDERSVEIFRMLARENRPFTFVPGRGAASDSRTDGNAEEIAELSQPEDGEVDERGVAARHADTRLQTRLTPSGLQKCLLEMYFDARTLEEEQGVNILYLALGALKWIDPQNAFNIRYAPLILVPVALDRGNAAQKFKLRARQEEFASNLSLEAFLERIHGIKLTAFEASDAFDPEAYMAEVADAVSVKPGWEVLPDQITLGFFSFAKFLMYRDLDAATWPAGRTPLDRKLVLGLLRDGFEGSSDMIPEDAKLDEHIKPADMLHIVDCDSSQALAVHEVRRGRDMVIQGPPGTGKSQTIANIVASAVADGKRVLFVAEKMAALEVVKRRLDATGVGDVCLELHSNKANKRAVLEELRRTWELGAPRSTYSATLNSRIEESRDRLNAHAARMHVPHPAAGRTPYEVLGQLTRLKLEGGRPSDIALGAAQHWTPDEFAERYGVLSELVERVELLGTPDEHVWRGVGLSSILPNDVDRLTDRLSALANRIAGHIHDCERLACRLELKAPETLAGSQGAVALARRIAGAPKMDAAALGSEQWGDLEAVEALLAAGRRRSALSVALDGHLRSEAWQADADLAVAALRNLPASLDATAFARMAELERELPLVMNAAADLAKAIGRDAPTTLGDARRLAVVAERVGAAPDASPDSFAADLWTSGVDRAADLAASVATLEESRARIGSSLTDAAWGMDLGQARVTLAAHGTGMLRIFSGEWRQANRLVRSALSDPNSSLETTLALLDALARGRAALATVREERAFGASAFGPHWRDSRSASAPLKALVEWMRSLRGLGAEPRLIAARGPDRRHVGECARKLSSAVERTQPMLETVARDLGESMSRVLGHSDGLDRFALASLQASCRAVGVAERTARALFVTTPATLGDRLKLLDQLAESRRVASELEAQDDIGRDAFGGLWRASGLDWKELGRIRDWVADNVDIRLLASRVVSQADLAFSAIKVAAECDVLIRELADVFDALALDRYAALGGSDPAALDIRRLGATIATWSASGEHLHPWVNYRDRAHRGRAQGCGDVVERLADGRLRPSEVIPAFEMAYYEALYADMVVREPDLGSFDGTLHGRLVRDFAEMDLQRIAAASYELIRAHHAAVPPRDGGAIGPLGVLRSEMARKRGHMPIRKLMERAAPAIQALKPVFMMSPLSVAQFLPPGVFEFDLLVMDEASQIQPVDALGAVARAKQVVVVGDPKQLPPTAFFAKMTSGGEDDDDEDGAGQVADIESILGLFTARGLPNRMLRWHYRSKHQSLIAVSNRQFYENKLFIVPSPYMAEAGMGLRFHRIPDGLFDAGGTRTNQVEARVVAQAIVAHARANPQLSLGVAAFSAAQRRAIVDQLELLRRTLPSETEAFFQAHPSEPFFVKNLENVQGDERDVIFISVGYGPTVPGGRVPKRFGPLGTEGGERRLNVLISRAKQRCEVFTSMSDEDIDADFAQTRKGVFAFKLFLHFARTGRMTIAESTGRDHDTVFEEQVARALQGRGYQVHRQVGLAGFYIDLAVADEAHPGRYLLGIECDGVSYHDARSARDRDRLRQSVLESHGWTIHRVWSTDWFQRPGQELERVIARIETAKAEAGTPGIRAGRAVPYEIITVERDDATEIGISEVNPSAPLMYVEATLTRPPHLACELHDAPRGALSAMAEEVVAVESPVHLDEVVARLRAAWGLKRTGGRIQEAVTSAIDVSVRASRIQRHGDFLSIPGRAPAVRDRSGVASTTLRRPEALPPDEIECAILSVVVANFGATDEQVMLTAARALGFKATSAQLRDAIASVVEQAVAKQWLARKDGLLVVGNEAPAPPKRTLPPSPLATLLTAGEGERLEYKETLRWDVELGKPNKKLEDLVVKTLAGFANRVGGTLLIGVADDGAAKGLERDYGCLGGNRDKFELYLTELFAKHFGHALRAARIRISFPVHEGAEVCRVDIDSGSSPVFVSTADRLGNVAERFFVRSGNSTRELSPSETARYLLEHFG